MVLILNKNLFSRKQFVINLLVAYLFIGFVVTLSYLVIKLTSIKCVT